MEVINITLVDGQNLVYGGVGSRRIKITGSPALTQPTTVEFDSNYTLPGGFIIEYEATPSGTDDVTLFGTLLPDKTAKYVAFVNYDGTSSTAIIVPAIPLSTSSLPTIPSGNITGSNTNAILYVDSGGTVSELVPANPGDIAIFNGSGLGFVTVGGAVVIDGSGNATLQNGIVDTNHIIDGAITEPKLDTGVVTSSKIAASAVNRSHISQLGMLYASVSDVSNAAGSETLMANYDLPGGTLNSNGDTIKILISGTTAATANTKAMELHIDGSKVAANTTTTAPNNLPWRFEFTLIRTSPTSAYLEGSLKFNGVADEIVINNIILSGKDFDNDAVAIEFRVNAAGGADVVKKSFFVEMQW